MIKPLRLLAPALGLLLLFTGSCTKDKDESPLPESPIYEKEVSFLIFTETDYQDARWEDSRMRLSLQLYRRSNHLQQETTVLDTTFAWMPFQELPLKARPLQLSKKLQEVHQEQEDLVLAVTKVVSINGYETVFDYDQTLDHSKRQETVEVKL